MRGRWGDQECADGPCRQQQKIAAIADPSSSNKPCFGGWCYLYSGESAQNASAIVPSYFFFGRPSAGRRGVRFRGPGKTTIRTFNAHNRCSTRVTVGSTSPPKVR